MNTGFKLTAEEVVYHRELMAVPGTQTYGPVSADRLKVFDPKQPRDERGRWGASETRKNPEKVYGNNAAYGGIPTVGGYQPNTEYEIGGGIIAEALHCVLGSLHRARSNDISAEKMHIAEEIDGARKAIKEYSRPIYLKMIQEDTDKAKKSRESIIKASNNLKLHVVHGKEKYQKYLHEDLRDLSSATYIIIYHLADAMKDSAEGGVNGKVYKSAFADPLLSMYVDRVVAKAEKLGVKINKSEKAFDYNAFQHCQR